MPRVPTLEKNQVGEEVRTMFAKMEARGSQVLNIFKTAAHCPAIAPHFLRLGRSILFKGSLPKPLRELAIIRVGLLARADYEVAQHIPIGRRVGLTEAQIDTLNNWHNSPHFDGREKAVLQYTDEVAQDVHASDRAFHSLGEFLSQEQIVELTITIGYYGMVCRVLESLEVALEE